MSPDDFWPLLETGFKMSMGAALAIGCFWVGRSWSQYRVNDETPLKKRIGLLEDIASDVGQVNHSFAKYSALVIESTRFGKRWPPARKQELEKINAELVREFERLSKAESQLLMLGEKTMEKTLRLYAARIALFRKQVYVGRQDISEQEIAELKTSIMQLREQFYDLLSRRYDKLLTV